MKRWLGIASLSLAACGGSASTDRGPVSPLAPLPPVSPPAFPALARADLVATLASGELAAYSIAGDKLTELGRVALASAGESSSGLGISLDWLDRERLLVSGLDAALVITPAGRIRLAVPGDEAFSAIPEPKDHEGGELTQGSGGSVVREGGRAFWSHCAWGFPVDGFQCERHARIQIWPPDPAARVEVWQPDRSAPEAPRVVWTEAPAAFALGTTEDHLPTCQDHGRTVTLGSEGQHGYEVHWLAVTPAALLVVYGEYGLADWIPTGFAVFDRCREQPVLVGRSFRLFSDGLWLSEDAAPGAGADPAYVTHMRRNLAVLGELPAHHGIAMRPHAASDHAK